MTATILAMPLAVAGCGLEDGASTNASTRTTIPMKGSQIKPAGIGEEVRTENGKVFQVLEINRLPVTPRGLPKPAEGFSYYMVTIGVTNLEDETISVDTYDLEYSYRPQEYHEFSYSYPDDTLFNSLPTNTQGTGRLPMLLPTGAAAVTIRHDDALCIMDCDSYRFVADIRDELAP